jgi:hypothetical protein
MRDVIIETDSEKGRSVRATLLASVEADLLWSGGMADLDHMRPVWAMFATSDSALKSFMANLRTGRKAVFTSNRPSYSRDKKERIEFLKSVGYRVVWQREEEGSIATIYLPELFRLDPGMVDPEGASFVILPTKEWHAAQNIDTAPLVKHVKKLGYDLPAPYLEHLAPISYLFAAYLDRRTRCPLVADGRFYLQLMLSCLEHKKASFSAGKDYSYGYRQDTPFGVNRNLLYHETEVNEVGLLPGLAFHSDHVDLEKLLASTVSSYFDNI